MTADYHRLFSEVPLTYELVNHILTLSLDTMWRMKAARMACGLGGARWIDVCSGTGQLAVYLSRRAEDHAQVYATDFSLPMLAVAMAKPEASGMRFSLSDVRELPFADDTFDLLTISFATRNLNSSRDMLVRCFREFHRVLKKGGHFVNLDTSQPSSAMITKLFHLYVNLLVRAVGGLVSDNPAAYACLSTTIRGFYPAEELAGVMREAGFDDVRYRKLFPGIAAIHIGAKH